MKGRPAPEPGSSSGHPPPPYARAGIHPAEVAHRGRQFGVRGGHHQFLAELRNSTLPTDMLRSLSRSSAELTSSRVL